MPTNETLDTKLLHLPNDGILEHVASTSSQVEVDYFIYCICKGQKEAAYNALIATFSADDADEFIEEVAKLHADDLEKVRTIQNSLRMPDEQLIELAQTILRVLT